MKMISIRPRKCLLLKSTYDTVRIAHSVNSTGIEEVKQLTTSSYFKASKYGAC